MECFPFCESPFRILWAHRWSSQSTVSSCRCQSILLYCGRVPAANAPGCTVAEGLLYKPWSSVVPTCSDRCLHQRTLVVKGGTTWARNGWWILPENARLPRNIQGSFTCRKCTTWDKRLYFPSEGRRAEDFFSPWKIRRFRPGLNPRTWVPKPARYL